MKKTMIQTAAFLLAVLFCVAGLSACSGSAPSGKAENYPAPYAATTAAATTHAAMAAAGYVADYDSGYAMAAADEEAYTYEKPAATNAGSSLLQPGDSRKLIRNASMSLQTEQYEASVEAIREQIRICQGYIENSSAGGNAKSGGRWMELTVRVPADRLEEFMAASDGFGVLQNSNIWQEDVTMSYTDMETRLATLNTKKDRLLAMLEKATKMSDIIELENALSDTIYEIESYTSNLNRLDDRIAYSTVNLSLYEVYKATEVPTMPKTLGERISQQFKESMEGLGEFGENLLVFLVGALPVLVILAILAVVIVLLCRAGAKRRRRRNAERMAQLQANTPKIGDPAPYAQNPPPYQDNQPKA